MFVARQPIFNKELEVYGYELLFRDDENAKTFSGVDATVATSVVLNDLFEEGIEVLTDNKKAFINFNKECINLDSIELIPPEDLVIEVLEHVKIDNELIQRLKELRKKKYKIALDDFVEEYDEYELIPYADIIKYDLIETPLDSLKIIIKKALEDKKILLAEKIETVEEFEKAKKMGFHLFQGYFFSKPNIISKTNDNTSSKATYSTIIKELEKEEPSYQNLAETIELDVSLAYRFLKVASAKKNEETLSSIKKALVKMGFLEIKRWISVLMLRELATEKPAEILKMSLLRYKFSEIISINSSLKSKKVETSMTCLFSMIDAILDMPMEKALEGMKLSEDIKNALIYHKGPFEPICRIMPAYEKGEIEQLEKYSKLIHLDYKKLNEYYIEAIIWVNNISKYL